jgi:serine/threonine protein kinase/phosphoribosyl 1,2-cyclic phosphodiesterase/anti-anti-sigma regulatory factor
MPDAVDTSDMDAVRAYVSELPVFLRRTVGGNTSCIEIQTGNETIIIDAGSGIRELGLELMKGPCGRGEGTLHLVFTHCHWDHLQGFPFFVPAFIPGNKVYIYGIHDIKAALEGQQQSLFFPIPLSYLSSSMQFIQLQPQQPFYIGNVRLNTLENAHPGRAFSYRIEDRHNVYVHASDAEFKELDEASITPFVDFCRGADVLTFDTQFTTLREVWHHKVDWGHSSAMIGVDMARMARVKKLVLFHHDPAYSDNDLQKMLTIARNYQSAQEMTLPTCEIDVAYEGLTLDLTPQGAMDVQLTGDVAILTPFNGRHAFDQLAEQLAELSSARGTASSVIDLSRVETLTTASLKEIVALSQKRQDGPVVLAAPSDAIQEVIRLAGYLDYFPIYTSVETALTAVQARESLNLPGQLIKNRYQIQTKIDEDPLSAVLKATDTWSDQTVALKILNPSFSTETVGRVMRQSQKIVGMLHPNIVEVLALDKDGDFAFIVEEFMTGQSLHDLLTADSESTSADDTLDIALELTQILEFIHSQGIIHTDLRPQNIFLTDEGIKLGGFGLGRLIEGRNLLDAPLLFLPTPYLAPEQILGQSLDARTDLYALGVILYRLFTGRLPFTGSDEVILQAHLHEEPIPLRQLNPTLSPSLEHLVLKLLTKNPNGRYASAQQAHRVSSSLTVGGDEQGYPLIAREAQLDVLHSSWRETVNGTGQLIFITGESGVGKTTLVQQVAAQSEPQVLLIGRCHEVESKSAYHLFSEILRGYFTTIPPEFFDDEARQLLSNFVRLVPEIREMLPDLPISPPLQPEQEQLRLMTSLTQFIKKATAERPWFVILDNLQWADSSSLELLRYLSHHLPVMPLMLVGIYRDVELEAGHPLLEMMRDLGGHPTYREISLDRLDLAGVEQILAHIYQQDVPKALSETVYEHTEGNPFYVEELANGLRDDGLVVWQNGRWRFPKLDQINLPSTVHEAVWRQSVACRFITVIRLTVC